MVKIRGIPMKDSTLALNSVPVEKCSKNLVAIALTWSNLPVFKKLSQYLSKKSTLFTELKELRQ